MAMTAPQTRRSLADFLPLVQATDRAAGALTVAGQRRISTVFPNILAMGGNSIGPAQRTITMSSNSLR